MHKKKLFLVPLLAAFLGVAVVMTLFISLPIGAQEIDVPNDSLLTINGSIAEVDAEGRKVTVTWLYDTLNHKYQDLTMAVAYNAAITKDAETIELDDLEQGDEVVVRYAPDPTPLPQAVSITVS